MYLSTTSYLKIEHASQGFPNVAAGSVNDDIMEEFAPWIVRVIAVFSM
jgi:hypothetical protein